MRCQPFFLAIFCLLIFSGCKKNLSSNTTGSILPFTVSIFRGEDTARLEWTSTSYSGGNDIVRFKVYLNNQLLQNTDTVRHYTVHNITPGEPSDGKVVAYLNSGITADVSFTIKPYSGIAVMGRQDSHSGQNVVEAYDIYSGNKLWNTPIGPYNTTRFSEPIFSHDTVFLSANSNDFLLYAFNIKTGAILYKAISGSGNGTLNGLTYTNGRIYAINNISAVALNASNGSEIWRVNGIGGPGFIATPLVSGNKIYYATYTPSPNIPYGFYALDINTGSILWSFPISSEFLRRPVVYNGMVIFSTRTNMYALRESDGSLVWQRAYDNSFQSSGLSVIYNDILITSADIYHGMYGLNPLTGATIWNYWDAQRLLLPTNPAIGNGVVYVGEYGPNITQNYLTALNPQTGTIIWQKSQKQTFTLIAENKLYSRSNFDDDIIIRNAATGDLINTIGNPGGYYNNETSHFSLWINGTPYYYSWNGNYKQ